MLLRPERLPPEPLPKILLSRNHLETLLALWILVLQTLMVSLIVLFKEPLALAPHSNPPIVTILKGGTL